MEYYGNKLCVSHSELTNGVMSKCNIDALIRRNQIEQVRRGCYETPALFSVESLPEKYKAKVYQKNPDLQEKAESKPFIESITPDGAAMNFYETYLLADGRHLPLNRQIEYANNAAILNGFRKLLEKANSERRKQSRPPVSKAEFWKKAAAALPRIADKYPHSLRAGSPRRLQEKFNNYIKGGYMTLISGKYLNNNAAKVETETQESLITRMLADHRNLDNDQIAKFYNSVAAVMGWETITARAIGVWREKKDLITSAGRLGKTNFYNKKTMQVRRAAPSAPMLFWTVDGWDVELYYQKTESNKKNHNVTTYHNRLTVVVVLDPHSKYPIGYAIGTHETPELVRLALADAANHTAELFGQRYRVNQIQSDRYALKNLLPSYGVVGDKVTPAGRKNAKAKVVERYFHYLNKTYCQLQKNWSGHNITSKNTNQPNSEALNFYRKDFPDMLGCMDQIARIIEFERQTKGEQYIAGWQNLSDEYKLPLSDEQFLLHFGQDTGHKIALEGHGLNPRIEGIKRSYDCFDPKFREYAHVRWTVKYDPTNLERVLAVNDDGSLQFILEEKYVQPMALADRKEGDAQQLTRVFQHNRQLEEKVVTELGSAYDQVNRLFNDNPKLSNTLAKAVLTDSRGQHKDRRNEQRLKAEEIRSLEYTSVESTRQTKQEAEWDLSSLM